MLRIRLDGIRDKVKALDKNGTSQLDEEKLEDAFKSYSEAITQLQTIPEEHCTLDDWRNLATCQYMAGLACKDLAQKLRWYEEAVQSLLRVSGIDWGLDDWRELATYRYETAIVCKKLNQWKQAQAYFYSSLDAFNNAVYNHLIADIYDELQGMALKYSINQQLFSFAHAIFSGEKQPEVKNKFLQLHLAIVSSSASQSNVLHRWLLQLMQLIESGINTPGFPNEEVKKWLSDKDSHAQFKKLLQELKQANEPLSLLKAIDQAPNFSVAVASKLLMLDEMISTLKEEVQGLKNENKQLKALLPFQPKSNYYQGHFTVFKDQNRQKALQDIQQPSEDRKIRNRSYSF
jgi:hypothetical protein